MGRRGAPGPGGSFADRVMARVTQEPTPSPARVFGRSLRRLALRDALAALATAWRLAFEPTSSVGTSARASAAALFLGVVLVVGLGGAFAAGGALAFLGSDDPAAQQLAPGASPAETPAPTVEPTPAPTPTPSLAPTPEPTQVAGPSVSEREKASGSDREKRETPEPKERETDKKKETPEPKERDEKDEKDERDERDEKDDDD